MEILNHIQPIDLGVQIEKATFYLRPSQIREGYKYGYDQYNNEINVFNTSQHFHNVFNELESNIPQFQKCITNKKVSIEYYDNHLYTPFTYLILYHFINEFINKYNLKVEELIVNVKQGRGFNNPLNEIKDYFVTESKGAKYTDTEERIFLFESLFSKINAINSRQIMFHNFLHHDRKLYIKVHDENYDIEIAPDYGICGNMFPYNIQMDYESLNTIISSDDFESESIDLEYSYGRSDMKYDVSIIFQK